MPQIKSHNVDYKSLLNIGFAILIIGFVLFKPLSNVLIELSEEGIELSEDLTEEDSEKESSNSIYEFDWKWHSFEATICHDETLRSLHYADPHLVSDFRPETQLPPPKC